MANGKDAAKVRDAIAFFRTAVAEMRRIAEERPPGDYRLRNMADKCEAEIGALAEHFSISPVQSSDEAAS